MRNIELKARLHDREAALRVCAKLDAALQGDIHQVDTYFRVPEGRLKLRVNEPGGAELIFYRRPDRPGPKGSDYLLEPVAPTMGSVLAEALGVLAVVDKVRTLYVWENVRIHLDRVQGLGDYIEFEAVLSDERNDEDGHEKVARLQRVFGLGHEDLEPRSYSDLLEERG